MLAIGFRFPAGRFHATPWGRHVNEADVEWPPSPWRIVRALVAVWHRLPENGRGNLVQLERVLGRLSDAPPIYAVPSAIHSHVRHYMPTREGSQEKNTLIYDAFLRLDPSEELVVGWPRIELGQEDRELLDRLLSGLTYLGRAESWAEARRVAFNGPWNVFPMDGASEPEGESLGTHSEHCREGLEANHEMIPLLCPIPPREYETLLQSESDAFPKTDFGTSASGKGKKKTGRAARPPSWLEAVCMETAALRASGWSLPPGAQVVWYRRPMHVVRTSVPPLRVSLKKPEDERPSVARYAVYGKPLPRIEEALKVTETLRAALLRTLQNRLGEVPSAFSGHGTGGPSDHRHAFFLPEPDDAGRIVHLVVYAPGGLEPKEASAMSDLRRLYLKDGQEWELWLEGVGTPSAFSPASPIFRSSTHWISVTPYMHPWHVKKSFGPWDQILKECRLRHLPVPRDGKRLEERLYRSRPVRPIHFHRFRGKGGLVQPDRRGSFWLLAFHEPVCGPLALGFACHFGMGLFVPAECDGHGVTEGGKTDERP